MRLMLKRGVYSALHWGREQRRRWCVSPEQEVIYRDVFVQLLEQHGMRDEYLPVKSAANYSLLYLIARTVTELRIHRVLELGAGQSSILLDRLKQACGHPREITTLEHDARWLTALQPRVSHTLTHVPLKKRKAWGQMTEGYDFSQISLAGTFDLIIIDGPQAATRESRYNRLPALELTELLPPDGAVVIVDDAERPGEAYLTSLLMKKMRTGDRELIRSATNAAKRQELIAYGTKYAAGFF